jgi:alpha-1,2-mannosyltransferase
MWTKGFPVLDQLIRIDLRRVWAVAATGLLIWVCVRGFGSGLLDLRVYLEGGETWRSGADLYGPDFEGPGGLPFTYPPFAALLFSGLTPLPLPVIAVVFTAAGIALFTAACHVSASGSTVPWAGFGLAATCLLLEPLRGSVDLGQINLILIGLVATDCLLPRTPWPRGALVGLAAAIKLTPAIFVLFFLARGRWRPALTAVGTFAGAGLLGWLLAPAQSQTFWFHAMLDPGRVGGLAYSANQSLHGLLFRLGAPEPVWMVLCAVVLASTLALLPRLRDDLTAVLAVAAAGLLISPVSWSHHWVWIAPALLLLQGWVRVAVVAVFAVGPHWLLPTAGDQELAWTWWQHLIGNTYVWLALGFLAWCAIQARRHRSPGPGEVNARAGYLVAGAGSLPSSARAFRTMSASS